MQNKTKIVNLEDIKLTRSTIKIPEPAMYAKLKQSIKEYGLLCPLIVNNRMELLKGYKRYQALVELQCETANVIIISENINEDQLILEAELCKHELDPLEVCHKLKNIDRQKHNIPFSNKEIDDFIHFPKVDKTRFDKTVRENSQIKYF